MEKAETEDLNFETVWDDSEQHIDDHPLHEILYEPDEELIRLKNGGYVKTLPAKKLLESYYD